MVALGLTNDDIKQLSGVSVQQWGKYQRGESEPGITKIKFLFDLGLSPKWLFSGEGTMMAVTGSSSIDPELMKELLDPEIQTLVKGILIGLKAKQDK